MDSMIGRWARTTVNVAQTVRLPAVWLRCGYDQVSLVGPCSQPQGKRWECETTDDLNPKGIVESLKYLACPILQHQERAKRGNPRAPRQSASVASRAP